MNHRAEKALKIGLPVAVLLVGAGVSGTMFTLKPEAPTRTPVTVIPQVRVMKVEMVDLPLIVRSQGTVNPRTESQLVPEVTGRIIEVSPSFVAGGFFEAGDVLLRIDSHDYEQVIVQREAEIIAAQLRIAEEEAEKELAQWGWDRIGTGEARSLTMREPQLASAKASLAAAQANLATARRNLDRTQVRAPYAGRVREKSVDRGQFVTLGTPVARIYAVDIAEIRLPLPDDELAHLDLPLNYRGDAGRIRGPRVRLQANFAGQVYEWQGRIVRTEGEIDTRTRMVHVVAEVNNPYGRGDDPNRPPLAAGMFVEAEIEGRVAKEVAELPRAALRGTSQVLVVDSNDRLQHRNVTLLRTTPTHIIVTEGLDAGEHVSLSSIETALDGMEVQTFLVETETPVTAPATPDTEEGS
jgi:multidrug efflux system membrane fusion protein